ncbi:AAA family ATPase [Nocardia aurea]|uniref:AAA family ATPase n=1 Tax=Nocardia aurea TaxID=2144174 RepID=UPI0013003976|nr:AAA family ATPase [Nocardia aurea]
MIIVLRGLMGAGKSRLAAQLAALDLTTSIVSRDLIREKYFHRQGLLSEEEEAAVSEREMAECIALLDRGDRVIIDATNLRPRHVQRWQHLAHSRGTECVIVDVHAPLEACIAAVAHRVRLGGHHVDAEVIRQTYHAHRPGTWYPPADYIIGVPPPAPLPRANHVRHHRPGSASGSHDDGERVVKYSQQCRRNVKNDHRVATQNGPSGR